MKSKNYLHWMMAAATSIAVACGPQLAAAQEFQDLQPSQPLFLAGEGSFFIDGYTQHIDSKYISPSAFAADAGNSMVNQMYVQYQKPLAKNGRFPLVIVHGCCLSSKSWQTTPDGRMGWDEYFVRQGFDTYLAEQVGRARSGFNALQYQKVLTGDAPPSSNPPILIATDAFAWNVFRWGNFSTLTPYSDEQFPMNTVGVGPNSNLSFYNQVIPDLNSTLPNVTPGCADGTCTPADPNSYFSTPSAMAKLANDLGGAILMGHSQSSGYPTMAALQPGSRGVRGIIQLEVGCFANLTSADINILKRIPILIVVADHYPAPNPPTACVTEMQQINSAGGDMTFISLPNYGLHGNSHMMMLDRNNLQVADVIIRWIIGHVRGGPGRL
ncbi:MAG TPA: hypothetical protein VMF67_13415 [Rhizomicrobium sp.]|nr:hypothetical protein [Rhizomicrobium sp.]